MGEEPTESVEVSAEVVERVEARLPRTQWNEPGEYVTYVLEEVLYRVEESTDEDVKEVDEDAVKDRLKDLGYLNE